LLLVIPVDAVMIYLVYLLVIGRMEKVTVIQKLEKAGMYAVLIIFFVAKMVQ